MKWITLAVLATLMATAYAEELPSFTKQRLLNSFQLTPDADAPAPMLLELAKGQGSLAKQEGGYLANRVYGIYHKGAKSWVYTLTTFHGPLTKPLELLYKGTVLPGKCLGAANPMQRYRLNEKYHWVPTDEKETSLAIIPERPNEIKRVTYKVPPVHRDVFDETLKKK
jgi:hypothetical protein